MATLHGETVLQRYVFVHVILKIENLLNYLHIIVIRSLVLDSTQQNVEVEKKIPFDVLHASNAVAGSGQGGLSCVEPFCVGDSSADRPSSQLCGS